MSLIDLDELVLKCRNQTAREYINDALKCYKAGAYRASIVSTWLAVMYDVINKLQELSLTNDAAAIAKYADYQKAASKAELSELLKFEKTILKYCLDNLNIISHIEFDNLERIRSDRNKCAHPSVSAENEIFQPTPELARQHIRIAIESLLSHPPAQGTKALESLMELIKSDYFPKDLDNIIKVFQSSPLYKARPSLIRSFVINCLKKMFNQSTPMDVEKYFNILNAVNSMHHDIYIETFNTKVSNIIRHLDDSSLPTVLKVIIRYTPDLYDHLDTDIQIKLTEYVKQNQFGKTIGILPETSEMLKHTYFKSIVQVLIDNLPSKDIRDIFIFQEPESFMYNIIIKRYAEAKSYDEANSLGQILRRILPYLSKDQLTLIIEASESNTQISKSTQWESHIEKATHNFLSQLQAK